MSTPFFRLDFPIHLNLMNKGWGETVSSSEVGSHFPSFTIHCSVIADLFASNNQPFGILFLDLWSIYLYMCENNVKINVRYFLLMVSSELGLANKVYHVKSIMNTNFIPFC